MVPTISFRLLYGLLILRHDRRRLLWLETTTHPTAEWIAPADSLRPADGTRLPVTSSVTAIDLMARYLSDVFVPWAPAIALHPRGRRGKMGMRSG